MKKVFILLSLLVAITASSQDVNSLLRKGGSFEGLGRQGDTLVASGTVNYVLELSDEVYGVMKLAIESDSVSGTPAYTAYLQSSLNGETWDNIDTITHTGGADNYEVFGSVNATDTYYRVAITATVAAQKNNIKIWGRLNEGFVIQN